MSRKPTSLVGLVVALLIIIIAFAHADHRALLRPDPLPAACRKT